jgi:putative DeoR family transcriptional regulator (stage III sporulation protein D)
MMYLAQEKERCVLLATYLVENKTTVRAAAKRFGISKSTVHKDVTQVLLQVNRPLYDEVSRVLAQNKRERHLRGGEATRRKYLAAPHRQEKPETADSRQQTADSRQQR